MLEKITQRKDEYEKNKKVTLPENFEGRPKPDVIQETAAEPEEITTLKGIPVSPGKVKGRARVLIAGLVRRATPGRAPGQAALAPAYAGIRGGEPQPQLYEVAEFNVSIECQPDASHPGRWTIVGLVMGFGGDQEAEAQLWQAGARLASSEVSDTGGFCLDNLAPGAYDLVLGAGPTEVHIRDIEVGGASGRDPTHSDRTTDGPD